MFSPWQLIRVKTPPRRQPPPPYARGVTRPYGRSTVHRRGVDFLAVPMAPCPDDVNAAHPVRGSVVLFYVNFNVFVFAVRSWCFATTLGCYD